MASPRVPWRVARAVVAAFIAIPAAGWADTTPDTFAFAPMYNVRRLYPAAAQVAITGIDQPTPVTITNGEYATPHTAWTSGPGLVLNGDVVYVRHTASAGFDAPTTTTLTVGGVSAQFTTRTIKRKALTTGSVRDFNGDGHPDIIWRNEATGDAAVWLLDDAFATTGNFLEGHVLLEGLLDWTPTHFGDFDGDGTTDIVWRNGSSGETAIWLMADGQMRQGTVVVSDGGWAVTHAADFDGDGRSDLLWHHAGTGTTAMWLMDGLQLRTGAMLVANADWRVATTADLDGDGRMDLVWHSPTLGNAAWLVDGTTLAAGAMLAAGSRFEPRFAPDMDGDGKDDILWADTAATEIYGWLMDGLAPKTGAYLATISVPIAVGDIDGDGNGDFFAFSYYVQAPGTVWGWISDGLRPKGNTTELAATQSARAFADFDGDGRTDKAWLDTASSPQTTWMRYRVAPPGYPVANPPRPLIADPNWRLL